MMSDVHGEQEFHRNAPATSHTPRVPLKTLTLLFALTLLLNWADFQDFRPNMDTQTYGILARNILTSGDWTHLHYTTQAYAQYYQHPPLGIWLLALVFKLTGATEVGLKVSSTLFMLGTVGLTAAFAVFATTLRPRMKKEASSTAASALAAGLILLTSVRYLKPASGYLLDAPLTFFFTASALAFSLACASPKAIRTRLLALASGVLFVLAFLSKGLPALVLPVGILLLSAHLRLLKSHFAPFLLGSALPLGGLALHPEVRTFAEQYWFQSVSSRLGGPLPLEAHLAPLLQLLRTWWHWLPLGLWSVWKTLRAFRAQPRNTSSTLSAFPLLLAAGILGGFALNGHFLEHYMMPFYPLAAVLLSSTLSPHLAPFESGLRRTVALILAALTLAVALLPLDFQGQGHREPLWLLLQDVKNHCPARRGADGHLVFAPGTIGRWEGLALGAWVTGRDPWVIQEGEAFPALDAAILIRNIQSPAPTQWRGRELAQFAPYIAEVSLTAPPCGVSARGSY